MILAWYTYSTQLGPRGAREGPGGEQHPLAPPSDPPMTARIASITHRRYRVDDSST